MKKLFSIAVTVVLCVALWCTAMALDPTKAEEKLPPVAENLSLETIRGVPLEERLIAHGSENEEISFIITTPPGKGIIELGEGGHFIYTPIQGKRGCDYFGYRAVDSSGSLSQEATVIIKLLKPIKDS